MHPPCLPHASSACPTAQLGPSAWCIPVHPKVHGGKLFSNGLLHSHALPPPCPGGRCLGEHQLPEAVRGLQCGCKKTPKYAFGRCNKPNLACSLTSHKSASSKETHSSGLVFIPQRGPGGLQSPHPPVHRASRGLCDFQGGHCSFLRNMKHLRNMPFLSCKKECHLMDSARYFGTF